MHWKDKAVLLEKPPCQVKLTNEHCNIYIPLLARESIQWKILLGDPLTDFMLLCFLNPKAESICLVLLLSN